MANAWMVLRDCMVPPSDRRREMQEVVVADLHTCLEQLQTRTLDMETKVTRCGEQALFHMQQAKRASATAPARQRDRMRAKGHMQERRRMQQELDKASLMSIGIQKQIDSIVSSHMDMLIVDAMRGFNHAATKMGLPQRATEVDHLGEQLADRQSEVATMQEAILGIGASMTALNECSSSVTPAAEDDSDLWLELDELMMCEEDVAVSQLPSVPLTRAYQQQRQQRQGLDERIIMVGEDAALPSVPLPRAYQQQRQQPQAAVSDDDDDDSAPLYEAETRTRERA